MNLFENHEFSYFEAKKSSLMVLNFGYYKSKLVKRNLDIYKLMAGENSLVPHSTASAMKKTSLLAMQHHICIRKIGYQSNAKKLWL